MEPNKNYFAVVEGFGPSEGTFQIDIEVIEMPSLDIGFTATSTSCVDAIDGTLTLDVNGGAPPYTYNWSNGANSDYINSLEAGSYTVTIMDACGQEMVSTMTVESPDPISVSADISNTSQTGASDGSIELSIEGGRSPYTYQWSDNTLSNGNFVQVVNPIVSTSYGITVTDFIGCTASDNQLVNVLNCPACDLNVIISQQIYIDNGTPNDLSDDTFTFNLTITGNSPYGWIGGGLSGSYGETVTFGPYPVDNQGVMFIVSDAIDLSCQVSVGMNINPCIYLETCTCCQ